MINRVVLVGRLTAEPTLRKTSSGTSVASFTLAVDNPKSKQAEKATSFIPCVAYGSTGDLVANYFHKGYQEGIDGRIQTRSYPDRDGKKVYITEVIVNEVTFLDNKKGEEKHQDIETVEVELVNPDEDLPF